MPRLARLARRNILLPTPLPPPLSRVARACLDSPAKREKKGKKAFQATYFRRELRKFVRSRLMFYRLF